MCYIEDELKNHLDFEFSIHNSAGLNETRHVVNNLESDIYSITNMVQGQFKRTVEEKSTVIKKYTRINLTNEKLYSFFKNFDLQLTTIFSKEKKYNGNLSTDSIFSYNNEWFCVPKITLTILGDNEKTFIENFMVALGHELTHAFDLYQFAVKNNVHPSEAITKQNYHKIFNKTNSKSVNIKVLAHILYSLNRLERNAIIAQLRQELLNKKEMLKGSKSAFDLIKTTESYRTFTFLQEGIQSLANITDKDTQMELINELNSIMGKGFTTFNQLQKYFVGRWIKWKENFLVKASKIAFDVYSETSQGFKIEDEFPIPQLKFKNNNKN